MRLRVRGLVHCLILVSANGVFAQGGKADPKKDNRVDGVTFKEYTLEFSGVKVTAMLPEGAKLRENEVSKSYSVLLNDKKISVALTIDIFDEDDPYPLEDPDGKCKEKRIERNQKNLGMQYEYVKKVKSSDYTGIESLTKPHMTKSGLKFDQGVANRSFHLKRTAVWVQVDFLGDTVPEAIIRRIFDSTKIETPGPLREDPTKIVEDPKGIPTTIEKKVTFRTPGRAVKVQESAGTHWFYPKKEPNFDTQIIEGYFDPSLTHEGLLDFVNNSRRVSGKATLVKKADCGKQLGVIFTQRSIDDVQSYGRVVVVDPGAIVLMRSYPPYRATAEKVTQYLESLEIDASAPAIEVWKRETPAHLKAIIVKEAGVTLYLPGEPKTKVEKGKTIVFYSRSPTDSADDAPYLVIVEPVSTTLAKEFDQLKKLANGDPKKGPPVVVEMTYMGGRSGILVRGATVGFRYFTIVGDKQIQMRLKYGGYEEAHALFARSKLAEASKAPKSND